MTDTQTTIQELKERVRGFRAARGWMETDQKDIAISICLEAAELLEHFQWVKTDAVKDDVRWRKALGEEMADVLFLMMELAESFGIDLAAAFEAKTNKQEKKYPLEDFNPQKSDEEQMKAYYRIKAKTRTDYPFRDEGNVK
jgi:dCTP diphosphatase